MIDTIEYYKGRAAHLELHRRVSVNDVDFTWLSQKLNSIERRLSAIKALGSKEYPKRPILQFEGLDFQFLYPHFKKLNINSSNVDFCGSGGKDVCINCHERAVSFEIPISTFVDMDYDFSDFSLKEMENIRSSSPYPCLRSWTLETSDTTEDAIRYILEKTEETFEHLSATSFDTYTVQREANSITLETMRSGVHGCGWKGYEGQRARDEWEKNSNEEKSEFKDRWFNDHSLAEAVLKLTSKGRRWPKKGRKKIEEFCDHYISANCESEIQNLLIQMLQETGIEASIASQEGG